MDGAALPTLVVVIIVGGVIFALGYARAVLARANSDCKKTKAGLPGMRKEVWRAAWVMIKAGFWVMLALVVLVVWAVIDARNG